MATPEVPSLPEIPAMPEIPPLDMPTMPAVDGLTLPKDIALPEVTLPDLAANMAVPDLSALKVPESPIAGLNLSQGLTLPEGFALPPGTTMPEFSDVASAQQWLDALAKTAPPPG